MHLRFVNFNKIGMETIFISLPIFLIIFAGWFFKRINPIDGDWVHILNLFAYYVSLPALIVASFWKIDLFSKSSWQIISGSFLTLVLFSLIVLAFVSMVNFKKSTKTAVFLAATVGNTVYMGFPLIEFGFGKDKLLDGTLAAIIYLILPLLASIFLIRFWHGREHKISKQLYDFIKNPLVISVFAGAVLSLLKFKHPLISSFQQSLSLLGATASPVALFALGGFLHGRFLRQDNRLVFLVSFFKVAVFPLIVIIGSFYFFPLKSAGILALLSSMPVAVTTFVISEKFGLDKALIGNSILISTIISFIAVPIILFIF